MAWEPKSLYVFATYCQRVNILNIKFIHDQRIDQHK